MKRLVFIFYLIKIALIRADFKAAGAAKMQLLSLRKVLEFATRTSPAVVKSRLSVTRLSPCYIGSNVMAASTYSAVPRGSLYNDNFRLFFKNAEGQVVSPMHDIPLRYVSLIQIACQSWNYDNRLIFLQQF